MAIQCQVEFITLNNSNNNKYAYKINRSDIIFILRNFIRQCLNSITLENQFTNNVSSQQSFFLPRIIIEKYWQIAKAETLQ